jgi:cation diffusion facilitator family transporter
MASSKKALLGAAAANIGIAITKFVVGALTGSSVMISEGIHSLVDSGNSALMIFGGHRSRRGPDEEHPFGYGMELYFWSLVVAMVVFGGGGGLSLDEGIHAIVHPRVLSSLWPSLVVIAVAAIFEGASLYVGAREFRAYRHERQLTGSTLAVVRASKNPAIFLTVLEDTAALIGLAIAAVGVTLAHMLELPFIDGIASMSIGVVLMLEALLLGFECRGLIIGESARPLVVDKLRCVIARHSMLGSVEELKTLQVGADSILVFLRVEAPATDDDLTERWRRLIDDLRAEVPPIQHVFFELAPTRAS